MALRLFKKTLFAKSNHNTTRKPQTSLFIDPGPWPMGVKEDLYGAIEPSSSQYRNTSINLIV